MTADVGNHGHGPKWFEAAEILGTEAADNLAAIERSARHMAALVPRWARQQQPTDDTRDDIPTIPAIQTPGTSPVNLQTTPTEGDPMPLLDTIKNDIADVEAKLEGFDEAALGKFKAVMANPETAVVLEDLASVAAIAGIPVGVVTQIGAGIKALASVYAPAPAPTQPAA